VYNRWKKRPTLRTVIKFLNIGDKKGSVSIWGEKIGCIQRTNIRMASDFQQHSHQKLYRLNNIQLTYIPSQSNNNNNYYYH
jgi:hypothetical protein